MDKVTLLLRNHPDFAKGRAEAESEIAAGSLGYRIHGKVVWPLCDAAATVLRERYHVQLQVVGHCIVDIGEAAKAQGYNERMQEEFSRRFAEDVVEIVFREVERKRKRGTKRASPG